MKTTYSCFVAIAVGCLTVCSTISLAEVRLPDIFTANMVLQRKIAVPIWGWAAAEEKITVSFGNQTKSTVASADGRWEVELAPLTAGGPFTLTVQGKNRISLDNVLVGDVWLCGGQSNMEWPMSKATGGKDDAKEAADKKIRLFHVERAWATTPQDSLRCKGWVESGPKTVPEFSAIGYYFAQRVRKDQDVPIGLISSSWGGTRIEPWTPPCGFETVPTLESISEEITLKDPTTESHRRLFEETLEEYRNWIAVAEKNIADGKENPGPPVFPERLVPFGDHQQPTVLYNGMIHPFVPFAMKGAIWYQGEANWSDGMIYAEKMKALIAGWREAFRNPELVFYFAQLAPYEYSSAPDLLPKLWEAQAAVTKTVALTGMVVINDVGKIDDIHPGDKKTVGERLAKLALNRTYGKSSIVCDSPELDSLNTDNKTLVLKMKNAKSLKTSDGGKPSWFEIAGADGVYRPAVATISGTTLQLTNDSIDEPHAVRFAWSHIAVPNLVNEAGLPLGAFRAGEIPERGLLEKFVPDASNFKLLYSFNPIAPVMEDRVRMVYKTDNSKEIVGKVKRVGYFLSLQPKGNGKAQFVFVAMPPLDNDLSKLGVPTKEADARFQKNVDDVTIASNVPGVPTGTFAKGCNVEFWDCIYGPKNAAEVPGASDTKYDFGDQMFENTSSGYGSMQVHHHEKKQTIFAFNNFAGGSNCDIGIGNCTDDNPDWTFSHSATNYIVGQFLILVEME